MDKLGAVEKEFFQNIDGRKNTFGQELGERNFTLISDDVGSGFHVEDEFLRHGAGTAALRLLFEHSSLKVLPFRLGAICMNLIYHIQNVGFIFVWPSIVNLPSKLRGTPAEDKANNIVTTFLRKVNVPYIYDWYWN